MMNFNLSVNCQSITYWWVRLVDWIKLSLILIYRSMLNTSGLGWLTIFPLPTFNLTYPFFYTSYFSNNPLKPYSALHHLTLHCVSAFQWPFFESYLTTYLVSYPMSTLSFYINPFRVLGYTFKAIRTADFSDSNYASAWNA